MAYPAWLGGLGTPNPTSMVTEFSYFIDITELVKLEFNDIQICLDKNCIPNNNSHVATAVDKETKHQTRKHLFPSS